MFNLSAKGLYGVSAVLEMALRHGDGAVQVRDIAVSQKIPKHYLEQILVILKRGGVAKSSRGPRGGYFLADSPNRIKLLDVVELLEGPLEAAPEKRGDPRLQGLWTEMIDGVRDCLDRSIADLIEEICPPQFNYNI